MTLSFRQEMCLFIISVGVCDCVLTLARKCGSFYNFCHCVCDFVLSAGNVGLFTISITVFVTVLSAGNVSQRF